MLLSSSPPIHLLIEEGRIKSALESQGSLSQRRECLNQDTKGMWALPVTHREGAERKEHAKAPKHRGGEAGGHPSAMGTWASPSTLITPVIPTGLSGPSAGWWGPGAECGAGGHAVCQH